MRRVEPGRLTRICCILSLALSAACGETSTSVPLPAGSVTPVGGAVRAGIAGQPLADVVEVRVLGTDDQPLPRAEVTFTATGEGASVDPANVVTDADGIARTLWTLARTVGSSTLTATADGASTTITATGSAGPAASVVAVAGDNQTAQAGLPVPTPPSVRVLDAFGNPVAEAPVSFSVLAGGGRVTDFVRLTDAQGIATVGSWELGSSAGPQTLLARVEASGVANNPIVFTATATAVTAAQLLPTAGNNQSAQINRPVPVAPTVVALDGGGNPVAGIVVTFAATAGGGIAVGSRQVTDDTGTATVGAWFLGGAPGANSLTATAPGLPAVVFTATATPGLPASMTPASPTTQPGVAGMPVTFPPSVAIRDFTGNPVPAVTVTFTVTAGAGLVRGASGEAAATTAQMTTDVDGIATLESWRLGTAIVTNTVVATASGLPSVTFTATPAAGVPAGVVALAHSPAALQGTPVQVPPSVRVTDANDNPVADAEVVFAVTGGLGTISGATQRTDASGIARVGSWTLGGGAPPNTLTATVTGTGITNNPVTFTAQAASRIGITSVPAGPVTLGQTFAITVQLQNPASAAVSLAGVALEISIASGGGTLGGSTTAVTNASGAATFNVNVTGAPGDRTFTIAGSLLPSGALLTPATTAVITFN